MCPFRIIGKEYGAGAGAGRWWIQVKLGRHNHPFPQYAEGSRLGQIKPHEFEALKEQESQMLPPSDMLASLKRADPGNVTDLARVYNAVAKIRKEKRGNRTPLQNFLLLLDAHKYLFDFRLSGLSTLGDVVFSHPASKAMLNAYPQVIMLDCTYNTNMYGMPLLEVVGATSTNKTFTVCYAFLEHERIENYTWVLTWLASLFTNQDGPNVIVTDRELGLIPAVHVVFPKSKHHLCRRHIEQCVLQRALSQPGRRPEAAEGFKYRWNWAISAATEDEWLSRWTYVKFEYSGWPGLTDYCEMTWLANYSTHILSCHLDYYYHFGHYTTNRVEGEHHRVKKNLKGRNYPFDTIFFSLHKVMSLQITEIKKVSRFSGTRARTTALHTQLFKNLVRKVSEKAFRLISGELEEMYERGQDKETCGCYLQRTHGLPCAHMLQQYIYSGVAIPLADIHEYWQKLDIEFPDVYNEDHDDASPPQMLRRSMTVSGSQHFGDDTPHVPNIVAPEVKAKPSKSKKAKMRMASAFEKVMKFVGYKKEPRKKGVGRVSSVGSSQGSPMSISKSRNSGSQSSPGTPNTPTSLRRISPSPMNSRNKPNSRPLPLQGSLYADQFPSYILPYIQSFSNVLGDGNCGFRAVALAIYGNSDDWPRVRNDLLIELSTRPDMYQRALGDLSTIEALQQRIYHQSGPARQQNWMTLPECGHIVATVYNVILVTFSNIGGMTCFPLLFDYMSPRSEHLVLGHVDSFNHFILLHMTGTDHPMPPIAPHWRQARHSSTAGILNRYRDQMELFNQLYETDQPQRRQRHQQARKSSAF